MVARGYVGCHVCQEPLACIQIQPRKNAEFGGVDGAGATQTSPAACDMNTYKVVELLFARVLPGFVLQASQLLSACRRRQSLLVPRVRQRVKQRCVDPAAIWTWLS